MDQSERQRGTWAAQGLNPRLWTWDSVAIKLEPLR
jgi:hypothetical protein